MAGTPKDSREPLFENASELQKIFIKRRSYRKYADIPIEPEKIEQIIKTVELFIAKMQLKNSKILLISDELTFKSIISSSTKGIIGSINPWLKSTKARGFIVAIVDNKGVRDSSERNRRIAETSMAMQIAILRATELELATCWMAGINSREVERVLGLDDGEEVIAVSTLGYPPSRTSLTDYDFWANRLVSGRRKPISEIMFIEKIER